MFLHMELDWLFLLNFACLRLTLSQIDWRHIVYLINYQLGVKPRQRIVLLPRRRHQSAIHLSILFAILLSLLILRILLQTWSSIVALNSFVRCFLVISRQRYILFPNGVHFCQNDIKCYSY